MSAKEQIQTDKLPSHVAIIMDGNGRWAKQRGSQRIFGHNAGVKSVRASVEAAGELNIPYLSLYAFSTENWKRPKLEVEALMSLLVTTIGKEIKSLAQNNVRLNAIGNLQSLPDKVRRELLTGIEYTSQCTGLTLTLALSYSGRWEITNAMQQIAHKVQQGIITPDQINEQTLSQHMNTAAIPDPELMIRTSGEYRISNFMLWQLAYAEFYFTETLWPDFDKETFYSAIVDFQKRERRFGQTGEQVKK